MPAVPGRCLGAVAYEAYCESSDGKSLISGAPLPAWGDQAQAIQDAWDCAAHAVARIVRED
jgi:hypothetical protein